MTLLRETYSVYLYYFQIFNKRPNFKGSVVLQFDAFGALLVPASEFSRDVKHRLTLTGHCLCLVIKDTHGQIPLIVLACVHHFCRCVIKPMMSLSIWCHYS